MSLIKKSVFSSLLLGTAIAANAFNGAFGGGNGTIATPYIIQDAADLNAVRNKLSAHYKLDRDVNLSAYLSAGGAGYAAWGTSGWLPIGDNRIQFKGSLNGDGHKITGLWINRPSTNCVGLFGYLVGGVNINTLGVEIDNAKGGVKGHDGVGGLVGYNDSSTITACFFNIQTTGQANGVGGGATTGVTGKTTAQMQQQSAFTAAGWNFASVWKICDEGGAYPVLQWQACPLPPAKK